MASPIRKEKPDLVHKVQDLPHKPGVYLMRDRLDRVIYVGKARDLRKRVGSYFTPSRQMKADLKTRALLESIWDFEVHEVRSEAEAILLEGKLIKDYRPRYNVSFRDDKRFLLAKIDLNDPWPRFTTTRLRKDDGARYFGPYAHSGALRSTLNWLNKQYGLRSCRPKEPGLTDYEHCHNDIIKNCTAPCIGNVSREDYLQRCDQACQFLSGQNREMIDHLEKEMMAAAKKQQFEKAAELRDMLEDLKRTTAPKRKFTHAQLPTTVIPEDDISALADVLQLPEPPEIMECFDISNISTTHVVASMVSFRNGKPDKSNYRRYRIKTVEGQDDFAGMAEVVRRRYSRVLLEQKKSAGEDAEYSQENPAEMSRRLSREGKERGTVYVRLPDLIIVDGGKGQLSAACKELQKLGLHDLPIIGLAKQFEEIFRPDRPEPLRLPHDSGALRLLQRIRDEAHRFANTYHRLLLKKRMDESILDDCPGVSRNRKKALLSKFGSVERLRKADPKEIAEIDGMSERFGEQVIAFLEEQDRRRKQSGSSGPG